MKKLEFRSAKHLILTVWTSVLWRWTYLWQENDHKGLHNSHLRVTFISDQSLEKRHQEEQELRKQLAFKKLLLPLNCRPGPLSAKKKWISAMKRTKPRAALVKLRPCHVPLDSEKAVCQAFMAQLKRIQSKKKPPPNPQFILRPPLRMAE